MVKEELHEVELKDIPAHVAQSSGGRKGKPDKSEILSFKREPSPVDSKPASVRSSGNTTELKEDKESKKLKKVKTERNALDKGVLETRLQAAGIPLHNRSVVDKISKDVYEVLIPRIFMSNTYGGNPQELTPKIGKEKFEEHGYNDFMYMTLDYHPAAPQTPGFPGLFFEVNGDADYWNGQIKRVFTRVCDKGKALWQYQGQYELKRSTPISREEWGRQTPGVKNTWYSDLHSKSWGWWYRARVYAREHLRLGRDPTKTEIAQIVAQGLDKKVTQEEIAMAFSRGDEALLVFTMKCLSYDIDFQRDN